ncbi:MAG TPA: hypothetical protein VLF68_01935 [Candidatus Saccharimonadales bacterium]|nr:hypothetical protein [Candidatus Saccharimonadales bacterium]
MFTPDEAFFMGFPLFLIGLVAILWDVQWHIKHRSRWPIRAELLMGLGEISALVLGLLLVATAISFTVNMAVSGMISALIAAFKAFLWNRAGAFGE